MEMDVAKMVAAEMLWQLKVKKVDDGARVKLVAAVTWWHPKV